MGESDFRNYDLDQLRIELEQEKEMKEMLQVSVSELRGTMADLEKRLQSVEGEGNEWKTRYETQVDLNRQLEQQISLVQEKLEDLRGNPDDRLSSIRSYDGMTVDGLKQLLKQITNEKANLQAQLMDYSLKIVQEAKAYHKANDERRAYLAEITKMSTAVDISKKQQTARPQGMTNNQQKKYVF
ncbi:coiled-coil domain containing 169 [Megalops cyprinoides]|uniref:coiled-coil domain containing 169 n=1 Tax=Megalops cyprinoides TaxID=118141 RepID=UPI00186555B5|nr:coiled-coil domain containing 169 [Megalops cyprinoides]